MGIGIFCLIPGWILLEVLGYSKTEIFQNLVYWACFLLICAVHELSKRTEKEATETKALRVEIAEARNEIQRLQADLREFRSAERVSLRPSQPSPMRSVPSVASDAVAQLPKSSSVPRDAVEVRPPSEGFSLEVVWGPALLALIFLLIKFWHEVGAWVQSVLHGAAR